ncbi:disease resistance protein At4g27190-like [Mangifera indica]|uniref:disease resistance protein At4g27190-like n=1 Tax=Mangifera indica TaxID=29780 RepID=UPI001CF94C66|nr:disease resistance protein At4g27190-like [Mangifera indica]
MTTNIAESFNALVRHARGLPITMLLEFIRGTMQRWFYERRTHASECHNFLTPWAEDKISNRLSKSASLDVRPITPTRYQVVGFGGFMGIVDLGDMSCTCRKFQLSRILCKHVIAVARHMRLTNVHAWVHPFFRTDIYHVIYQKPINPLGNQCDWLHSLEDRVILPPVLNSRCPAASDQLSYLFHYNDNIQKLKKQVEKLRDSRDMVQKKIESAERNGEIIFTIVRDWLAEVDDVSAKAEEFLERENKANKRCLKGWCINLSQRSRFSQEAKKHTQAISDQLQERGNFKSVSCPAPPSRIISSSEVFNSGPFKSRNSIKKEVLKALINANNVNKIGICGMAGIGKTTLVEEISQYVIEAKLYDVAVRAIVSQTPSIMKIQGEIADILGFTSLPTHSELARASSLWERIKKEKQILIILDDVWEIIKLDKIGIPFGNDHRGCKILITSRRRDVCNGMECQKIYTVETLSKRESWELFSKNAGSIVKNFDINPIAREVTTQFGGLPLAIVTIAIALKGQDKHVWSNVARQLKMSTSSSIPEMERNDYKIPIEDLVRYWTGLKWFGDTNEAIEDVRNKVHAIVSTLTSSFLLIKEGKKYVKMHDVICGFAIARAPIYNHKFMVNAALGHRDTFKDFTCISLMSNYVRELPYGLEYPKLEALLLQKNKSFVVPSRLFEKMANLKVLNLGRTYLEPLPYSLSSLSNLRTLDVSTSKLVDLSVIGRLSNLEILSLSNSKFVEEIPLSFNQLTNLKLLDLNNMNLKLIPHRVISSLQKLEELYINHFVNWQSKSGSDANLVELAESKSDSNVNLVVLAESRSGRNVDLIELAESKGGSNVNLVELAESKSGSNIDLVELAKSKSGSNINLVELA